VISFIVPAHNEEALLGGTLGAIARAAPVLGDAWEVLVVDDSSTDRTAAVAEAAGARVVRVQRRQIAATRNAGARAAAGAVLVFVDADTLVNAAVLRAAARALRRGVLAGGAGFNFDGQVPLGFRLLHALAVPVGRVLGLAGGCFLFCTRAAFEAAGGFCEDLFAAEEIAFAAAVRRRGRFVVLRECVTTSGRKLRTHSAWAILSTLLRLAVSGPGAFRRREGLELWYGERVADPSREAASPEQGAS
jgi:glycosyltransferase involved in cell wall biosynthesis